MGVSVDTGYWTGFFQYLAPYMAAPLAINMGIGADTNGISWIIQKLEGFDGPDTVGSVVQRAADHGGYPTAQFYGPRIMTLTLRASCPDQATRDIARATLQQVIPVNDLCAFGYNEPIPKILLVRRSGKIAEEYDNLCEVVFTIVLIAPDPRKYSQTIYQTGSAGTSPLSPITVPMTIPFTFNAGTAPGTLQAFNPGMYDSRPDAVLWGPLNGPAITLLNTGQTVSWRNPSLTMNAGDKLEVDFDARQSFLNGVYVPADITSAWFTLNPGQNFVSITNKVPVSNGGNMIMFYQAAWI